MKIVVPICLYHQINTLSLIIVVKIGYQISPIIPIKLTLLSLKILLINNRNYHQICTAYN